MKAPEVWEVQLNVHENEPEYFIRIYRMGRWCCSFGSWQDYFRYFVGTGQKDHLLIHFPLPFEWKEPADGI